MTEKVMETKVHTRLLQEQIIGLIVFVTLSFAAPALSALLSITSSGDWYRELNKPWFNPPGWIFGPVWTFLYATMGIAAWCVWRKSRRPDLVWPIGLFLFQLVLNALWTPLFFGMHRPGLALIDIIALWVAIVATAIAFYPISKAAAYLFLPYGLWVSFATLLNATIWWLNRS